MEIYILRHAIAVERGTPGYPDDSLRPLTAQGRQKMKANAKGMRALKISFDTILTSPYLRAKDTALIVAQTYKIKENRIVLTKQLTPEVSFESLAKEINTKYSKSKSILLVGHEPHLSELISFLLVGKPIVPIDFKKGGLCCLSADGFAKGKATLHWLLSPAVLQRVN